MTVLFRMKNHSHDESIFLSPIEEMIKKKVSLSNNLRARFNNKGGV